MPYYWLYSIALIFLQKWIDRAEPGTLLILSTIMMLINPLFIFCQKCAYIKHFLVCHQTEFNSAVMHLSMVWPTTSTWGKYGDKGGDMQN